MSVVVGIVEMDKNSTHLHPFGGPGSWDRHKEVSMYARVMYAQALVASLCAVC